jgi:hypothetical protein
MKVSYIYLGVIAILMWNGFIIQRDQKLFKAYDACTQFTHHPDCPYNKK